MLLSFLRRASLYSARALCQYRGRALVDALEQYIGALHRRLNNSNFDMRLNGERRVLRIISAQRPSCIFDVGANLGEWSRIAATLNPSCTIHAFEVVPDTFAKSLATLASFSNVIANCHGLSDEQGSITINRGNESDVSTACRIVGDVVHDSYYYDTVLCEVRRACDYIAERRLGAIDFVKVDVEGMDLRVIKGFGDALRNVRCVQFEYGIFNIASKDLLADFCQHFARHEFSVGKVYPRTVDFFDYQSVRENFYGSNYIAVRNSETHLLHMLRHSRE